MGDPSNPKPPSISLPPGCRFYPSEEQLVCYYLTHKNNDDRRFGFDAINEIDLYNYNPFDLPDTACFRFGRGGRKRHWYCYVGTRVLKQGGRRRSGGGYWRRRGRARDVVGGGKVVVGTRRRFVFYLGDSLETTASTNWVMYEYALIDRHEASFILCRLFVKSTCQNNNSEHVLSSCGEGSVGTLRHIGIQHDGTITSGIVEGIVHDETSVDKKNEVLAGNVSTIGAVAHAGVQVPSSVQPNEPVTASGLTGAASMLIGCFAAHHLMSILEEDYIELDDLAGPLSGIDFT
ncbi:NAC domain-containing protein 72-like [Actinidia eriantha]|uniref:NAC domain-containing protein 72-like n=1 Tax=Actinidia eriantha TaxID=165200 RepID=UPI00258CC086|nr:NAC domain-containing protein 72-like [Actinidia eriantha]